MMYQIFSLLLSALIISFIIKKSKFKPYEMKLINIKFSAIISIIVLCVTVINTYRDLNFHKKIYN